MTRLQYLESTRQLCNLVNVRRIQIGKFPLQHARIMRTVRRVLGPEPPLMYPSLPVSWRGEYKPIPYVVTQEGLDFLRWQKTRDWLNSL
jgi:hypothetical protein